MQNKIVSWENKNSQYGTAASIDLKFLFNIYSLDLNEYNRNICCPFSFHADDSPSFYYYPETNSFFCFGCQIGGGPIELLSNLMEIAKEEAITKLIEYRNADQNLIKININDNLIERQNLLLKFSTYIRQRICSANGDSEIENIEHNTFIFDQIYNSHKLSNKALSVLIDKIKLKLEN